jgi:RHS repeat-associated protein
MRNPANWQVYAQGSQPAMIYGGRGYTGHEHLNQFGLINMNARLYDPLLARFLAPDPFVASGLTNDFNRYVYARNNPMMYTDPSGKFIEWIIAGAIILGKMYNDGVKANHNTNPLKWNWSKATYGFSVGYNGTNGNVTTSASIGWNNNYSTNLGYTFGGAGFAFGNTVNGETHMANPFYSPVDPMQQVVQREREIRQDYLKQKIFEANNYVGAAEFSYSLYESGVNNASKFIGRTGTGLLSTTTILGGFQVYDEYQKGHVNPIDVMTFSTGALGLVSKTLPYIGYGGKVASTLSSTTNFIGLGIAAYQNWYQFYKNMDDLRFAPSSIDDEGKPVYDEWNNINNEEKY